MPKRKTTEEFINESILIHGEDYCYSLSDYKRAGEKIIITCKKHGNFLQTPNSHLMGKGCPVCGREKLLKHFNNLVISKAESFIEKSIKIHGEKYTYEDFIYTKSHEKSIVTCPKHGSFLIKPSSLLEGKGCELCSRVSQRSKMSSNTQEFIEKANIVHNYKFNYDDVDYVNSVTKVIIRCPEHDAFLQTPSSHLNGIGCKLCGLNKGFTWRKSRFTEKYEIATCYVVRLYGNNESFIKIGITGNNINNRKPGSCKYKFTKLLEIINTSSNIWDLEKWLHRKLKKFKYTPLISFGGETECFDFRATTEIQELLLNNPIIKLNETKVD